MDSACSHTGDFKWFIQMSVCVCVCVCIEVGSIILDTHHSVPCDLTQTKPD